jgi:hypothetical protein
MFRRTSGLFDPACRSEGRGSLSGIRCRQMGRRGRRRRRVLWIGVVVSQESRSANMRGGAKYLRIRYNVLAFI